MVCYQVIGNDLTVATAAEAGQLELNVMMPVIAHNLLASLELLGNAARVLADKCVRGIRANEAVCRRYAEQSLALVTALAPVIGYEAAARAAQRAAAEGKSLRQVILEAGLLDPARLDAILDLKRLTGGGRAE
jgi:aspartate ammonia-lyase